MRSINQAGLDIIKKYEGLKLIVYKDQNGFDTIGYGHKITPQDNISNIITQEEADHLLDADLTTSEDAVTSLVTATLNDNQFSALVSFVYNIGQGNFASSTMCKLLNAYMFEEAAEQFLRWNHANGQVSEGLLARRQAEQALFNCTDDNSTGIMAY